MGKIIVQCVNEKCIKKMFLFDFGQARVAPSLSFEIKCPHCGKINTLNFKVSAKDAETLPVLWALSPDLIIRLPDIKERKMFMGEGI